MLPIGLLMIEHRLIEKMINHMDMELKKIQDKKVINPYFIDIAVDFIRTYADRCHHGKEEDILFRDLAKKNLSTEDDKIMKELVEEHTMARAKTRALIEANEAYRRGDLGQIRTIGNILKDLTRFYPIHIEKEDKRFFIPSMKYFTKQEQQVMLEECYRFDRQLIHEKYRKIVENIANDRS